MPALPRDHTAYSWTAQPQRCSSGTKHRPGETTSSRAGQPATLLGYPVVEAEDMPDISANALSIAFGNFQAGYLIAQRRETVVLRDPFSNKPFVHFYATKRVGGTVIDSRAIKLMKFSA